MRYSHPLRPFSRAQQRWWEGELRRLRLGLPAPTRVPPRRTVTAPGIPAGAWFVMDGQRYQVLPLERTAFGWSYRVRRIADNRTSMTLLESEVLNRVGHLLRVPGETEVPELAAGERFWMIVEGQGYALAQVLHVCRWSATSRSYRVRVNGREQLFSAQDIRYLRCETATALLPPPSPAVNPEIAHAFRLQAKLCAHLGIDLDVYAREAMRLQGQGFITPDEDRFGIDVAMFDHVLFPRGLERAKADPAWFAAWTAEMRGYRRRV